MKKVVPIFTALFFCNSASSQTISDEWPYTVNIDIVPLSSTCVIPGDVFTFEVITRFAAGGDTGVALGNIDYLIDLGVSQISFDGVFADGTFISPLASTNGLVSGFMVDSVDADNEFIPSTSGSDFGTLRADDTLDRVDPDNSSWDADWVYEIAWTVPLDATPGTYEVTGREEVDIFTAGGQFADQFTVTFPGPHTPFSIKVIPEPSVALLGLSGLIVLFRFRNRSSS